MKKMLKSKEGISPILATLLLIVIAVAAVIVTYAWVMTFTSSTTGQSGAVLSVENIRFYNDTGTLKVDITIRNSGTADAKVVEVYQGTSSSNLQSVSSGSLTYDPNTQMVSAGSSLKITISPFSWSDGTRYYFKVVTEAGQTLPFSEEA
ncbi:MAG: archaellin/type IV pilin N-terminal domain-containing protein [Candidatus Bathyarchaeia archaeon]